jgi:hypothetical protein
MALIPQLFFCLRLFTNFICYEIVIASQILIEIFRKVEFKKTFLENNAG